MTNVKKIAARFANRAVTRWKNTDLTVDEQTLVRDKPRDYLLTCVELCRLIDVIMSSNNMLLNRNSLSADVLQNCGQNIGCCSRLNWTKARSKEEL